MSHGGFRRDGAEAGATASGPDVSLVLVHYHCADLAVRACAGFIRQAEQAGVGLEILVVDNGSDAEERRRLAEGLAELPGRVLEPGANLGYAGGLNLGAEAAVGDVLLFSNADLELFPGALEELLATLRSGADIAGPRFFWDRERRFLLPPNEARDRRSELAAALAGRGPGWARRARRRWRRHARRHWQARGEVPSHDLSGALLAVSRPAWRRAGPFDAGFRLYFEEVDWLRRAATAGLTCVHQPRAEVVHHYDRSAAGEERADGWFAESRARFEERWHGPVLRRLKAWLTPSEERPPEPGAELPPGPPRLTAETLRGLARRARPARPRGAGGGGGQVDPNSGWAGDLWIEVSPLARRFPAAAERLTVPTAAPGAAPGDPEPWTFPADLFSELRPGRWHLTVVDGAGRELATASFAAPGGGAG